MPNIRVGQGGVTTTFNINNVGSGGPSLRGALQNAGISNVALTGSGVTAQNWGAIAQGASSTPFSITFNPLSGQALSGQTVQVVNNFDNVAGQTLTITGSAFNLATASAATPNPVVFANQRVGAINLTQALTITNTAVANGFSESLNATIASTGDACLAAASTCLAPGASSSVLQVGLNTASAGARSGQATITLASDGTGTSGFSALGIGTQVINVSGNVYNTAVGSATPTPVVIGNQRVGGSARQALTVANTAAAGAFSEALNASFSGATGTATNNGGSVSNLIAGGSNAAAMSVGVNTASAGAKSGNVTVSYTSDGTGANGNSGLAAIGAGGQVINVSGNVYNLAVGSTTPTPVHWPTSASAAAPARS